MTNHMLLVEGRAGDQALRASLARAAAELGADFAAVPSVGGAREFLSGHGVCALLVEADAPDEAGAAELLNEVAREWPEVVRIAVGDRERVGNLLDNNAHQRLPRRAAALAVKGTLERALGIRALLRNEPLRRVVARLTSLPALPAQYEQLVRELESPLCSAARLGRIIERDPSLTAKVLQYANSAAVGARREVTEAVDAVRLLGCEAVSSLALAVHAFSRLEAARLPSFSQKRLWEHSLAVAGAARAIASEERARAQGDESFTAGLLHDVGKLVLASNLPDWYGQAVELARAERLSDHEAEREVFGATHAEVGAYLLSLWGLPGAVVEAVAHHHEPRRAQAASFSALAAVHAANALLHEAETHGRADAAPRLDVCFLQGLGLDEHLDAWRLALG